VTESAPLPSPAPASSGAFLAAVTALGLAALGIHLDASSQLVLAAIVLAAFVAPCWLAIGLHLASRPPGGTSRRARALLVLSVAFATLLLVTAAGLLLFATHVPAALAYAAACLVAGLALERGS
jgi:hypothetical protein